MKNQPPRKRSINIGDIFSVAAFGIVALVRPKAAPAMLTRILGNKDKKYNP